MGVALLLRDTPSHCTNVTGKLRGVSNTSLAQHSHLPGTNCTDSMPAPMSSRLMLSSTPTATAASTLYTLWRPTRFVMISSRPTGVATIICSHSSRTLWHTCQHQASNSPPQPAHATQGEASGFQPAAYCAACCAVLHAVLCCMLCCDLTVVRQSVSSKLSTRTSAVELLMLYVRQGTLDAAWSTAAAASSSMLMTARCLVLSCSSLKCSHNVSRHSCKRQAPVVATNNGQQIEQHHGHAQENVQTQALSQCCTLPPQASLTLAERLWYVSQFSL